MPLSIHGTNGITFNDGSIQASRAAVGFRNRVINGDLRVDQRNAGASQTFTAAAVLAYSVDRFYGYCTGANVTGQRVAGTAPNEFAYRFTGAASVTGIGFGTRLEATNTRDLAGSTATLSVELANSVYHRHLDDVLCQLGRCLWNPSQPDPHPDRYWNLHGQFDPDPIQHPSLHPFRRHNWLGDRLHRGRTNQRNLDD